MGTSASRGRVEGGCPLLRQTGGAALGRRFLDEYDHLCARLLVHPKLGAPRGPDRRGIVMRTFPYTLIYELSDAGIRVLVVKHNRRNPDHGLQRR